MSSDLLLTVAIGVGLVVSLLLSEVFGLAAGGVVVPGYLALNLDRPVSLALTLGVASVAFVIVRGLSSSVIIYGRRRSSLMILFGYALGVTAELVMGPQLTSGPVGPLAQMGAELRVIGYVIPGLIAIWFDRQGVLQTLSVMITAAVMVRLVLLALTGEPVGT
ncbi:MAG: poly-gamma-glutamate biosynthesis protein PgsC [Myxococcota bacterium]